MHVERHRGQSSVELVAVTGLLAIVAAVGIQIVVAARSAVDAAGAARIGTRAALIGMPAERAARGALPATARRRAIIERRRVDGRDVISVAIPISIGMPGGSTGDVLVGSATRR